MPAVLYHLSKSYDFSDTRIIRALATAGLVGNIVRTNASISGAEVGCCRRQPALRRQPRPD